MQNHLHDMDHSIIQIYLHQPLNHSFLYLHYQTRYCECRYHNQCIQIIYDCLHEDRMKLVELNVELNL